MFFGISFAFLACVTQLSAATVEQEVLHAHSYIIKQEQDPAAAKGMMRRQIVSKHDHDRHVTVFSSGGLSQDTPGRANANAIPSAAQQLAGVNGTGVDGTNPNGTTTLINGGNSTLINGGNSTATNYSRVPTDASSSAADAQLPEDAPEGSCFIAPGLKVVSLQDADNKSFKMAVREDNDQVSQQLISNGYYQIRRPEEVAGLAGQQMPPNGTLLDIGASLGWYTMLFARRGYKVVAIEPIPMNRVAINATLCLNPEAAANIKILPLALVANQDRKKICVMSPRAEDQQGAGAISCSEDAAHLPCLPENVSASAPLLEVSKLRCHGLEVTTLDMLLSGMAPIVVDFVKMDVDGMECDVMKSGESVFWRYNVKFLQVTTKKVPVAACFVSEAKKHGYAIGKHEGEDLDKVMYRYRDVSLLQSSGLDLKTPVTLSMSRTFGK